MLNTIQNYDRIMTFFRLVSKYLGRCVSDDQDQENDIDTRRHFGLSYSKLDVPKLKIPNVGLFPYTSLNLCYMDITLQCLMSYTDFVEKFKNGKFHKKKQVISYNLREFISKYLAMDESELLISIPFIKMIKEHFYEKNGTFSREIFGLQQDLAEFFSEILNDIAIENSSKRGVEESLIDKLFFLILRYEKVCLDSEGKETIEPCNIKERLFSIVADSITKISTYLEEYFKDVQIDGGDNPLLNSFHTRRRTVIISLPEYLHFQITKFNIDSPIEFEIELEIKVKDTSYELIGCVYRAGKILGSGHYYAILKRNNTWVVFNQSTVADNVTFLPFKNIYMLVYKKRDQLLIDNGI